MIEQTRIDRIVMDAQSIHAYRGVVNFVKHASQKDVHEICDDLGKTGGVAFRAWFSKLQRMTQEDIYAECLTPFVRQMGEFFAFLNGLYAKISRIESLLNEHEMKDAN
jgi:hypothetical protein